MKPVVLSLLMIFITAVAQASKYDCQVTDGSNAALASYSLDTKSDDNKFAELQDGTSVGCVVLRTNPELLTCGLGQSEKFSIFSTAQSGTSVLALDSSSQTGEVSLRCILQK